MKPGWNHLTAKGRITEFSWRYYERKVGTYLTLWTPLRAGPDGKTGFRTKLVWAPHGNFWLVRETKHLIGNTLRRERNWGRKDFVILDLKPLDVETEWVKVGTTVDGGVIERERFVRVVSWEPAWVRVEKYMLIGDSHPFKTDEPLADMHAAFREVLSGCAAQGRFEPMIDWIVERWPCLAPYFQSPGDL